MKSKTIVLVSVICFTLASIIFDFSANVENVVALFLMIALAVYAVATQYFVEKTLRFYHLILAIFLVVLSTIVILKANGLIDIDRFGIWAAFIITALVLLIPYSNGQKH